MSKPTMTTTWITKPKTMNKASAPKCLDTWSNPMNSVRTKLIRTMNWYTTNFINNTELARPASTPLCIKANNWAGWPPEAIGVIALNNCSTNGTRKAVLKSKSSASLRIKIWTTKVSMIHDPNMSKKATSSHLRSSVNSSWINCAPFRSRAS